MYGHETELTKVSVDPSTKFILNIFGSFGNAGRQKQPQHYDFIYALRSKNTYKSLFNSNFIAKHTTYIFSASSAAV
jgi:hypothetical protein